MMTDKPVAAVILAAGASSRMGRPKLLLPWGDGCVLDAVLEAVTAAPFDDAVVVTGAAAEQVAAVSRRHGIRTCHNPDFAAGQSTSLRAGLDSLPPGRAAAFILGDQPLLTADMLRRLLTAYAESEARLLQPRSPDGQRGHPVLFAPELFAELRAVQGDAGGRSVLQAHAAEIRFVEVPDGSCWQDLDTPEDYNRLRGRY
ncbi:MAG: nucleotidyltransferase family protein [Firmicutes bacterium]|nr:nucleotidyltransferase family protein [Bacillota bacterium]